jgi:hypothetical protein
LENDQNGVLSSSYRTVAEIWFTFTTGLISGWTANNERWCRGTCGPPENPDFPAARFQLCRENQKNYRILTVFAA